MTDKFIVLLNDIEGVIAKLAIGTADSIEKINAKIKEEKPEGERLKASVDGIIHLGYLLSRLHGLQETITRLRNRELDPRAIKFSLQIHLHLTYEISWAHLENRNEMMIAIQDLIKRALAAEEERGAR